MIKKIPGYNYWVTSEGEILTKDGKEKRQQLNPEGYLICKLWKDGKVGGHYIHRLVALTFLGPRPIGRVINHIDECKTNNSVTNLEYITHADNLRKSIYLKKKRLFFS